MKPLVCCRGIVALAPVAAACVPQVAMAQELINRRDQAQEAFLATPQGIYRHYCAHCHGDDAEGDGRLWATELSPSPADLTALKAAKQYVIAVIRDGSAAHGKSNLCPAWGRTISPENVARLAQYIVSLGGETSQPRSSPAAGAEPVREPFAWLLGAVLLAEILVLWRLLRHKKEGSKLVP